MPKSSTPKPLPTSRDSILTLILIQSLLAMLGSLYFSNFGDPVENITNGNFFPEDNGFYPCQLCWWARILMYPIVLLSLIGLIKKDKKIISYILPLALIGIPLEIYHYILQKFPVSNPFDCTLANPCGALHVNYFGFITIPFLCLVAFVVIASICIYALRKK